MSAGKPPAASEPESLIARWSRRKRCALDSAGEAAEPAGSVPAGPSREPAGPPPAGEHAPQVLRDSDMPPLDSLGPESDYSGFLSPGVSEELRRLALRRLFRSPVFNVTDGLDDYDDDFTSFEVLREAFHAKRERASASDPAAPEHSEPETVEPAEAERAESTREPSAEGSEAVHRAEAEPARPLPAEPEAEEETASEPPADTVASIATPEAGMREPDEARERAGGDSGTDARGAPPEGPDDSTPAPALPSEPEGEEESVAAPESRLGGALADAAPVGGAAGSEVTSGSGDSGRGSAAEPRHG